MRIKVRKFWFHIWYWLKYYCQEIWSVLVKNYIKIYITLFLFFYFKTFFFWNNLSFLYPSIHLHSIYFVYIAFFNIQPIYAKAMHEFHEMEKKRMNKNRKKIRIFSIQFSVATKTKWNNIGNIPDMHNLMKTKSDAVKRCVKAPNRFKIDR